MKNFNILSLTGLICLLAAGLLQPIGAQQAPEKFNIDPPHISKVKSIKYDYDIVYVRAPRWVEERGRKRPARWAEFAYPTAVAPGSDLMLLHPDGKEELLVPGGKGAIQDPYVSFDGKWVYYTKFHGPGQYPGRTGADIYKVHLESRKIVQLTKQEFTPNRPGTELPYGVYNMHPCPIPGGRVAFVSNRNGFLPSPKSYPRVTTQLFIMDEDGSNIETIGHLNLAGALHPVILKDGRIIFSSLENMGLRNYILWGIWSIHPDGTNWGPVVSALHGHSSPSSWHFQTQLSDENIVVELYYNQNQKGFGTLFKLPPTPYEGESAFGPGDIEDPRNPGFPFIGWNGNRFRVPFTPNGMELITPWIRFNDFPAWPSVWKDKNSPRIGKVTHPCGAPDNHLLLAWTLGPIGGSAGAVRPYMKPQPIDSGIYLLKDGKVTKEPGDFVLIKNDPKYNEQWPRPVVPYKRIYGVGEPKQLVHKNDGKMSKHLPEGTPFGLVGTSSMYKRESAPLGTVSKGSVTAVFNPEGRGRVSPFTGEPWNWRGQGSDAGLYENSDIHAIRILAFEPNAHATEKGHRSGGYPPYFSHAMERLRILGEIPVRHFKEGKQPIDPDGNPDTSFLAKIPADVAFTFQTIDKKGMVLNMAQTWHQVRPGEVRHNCGGCHAHSQKPTLFKETAAARPGYAVFDLTEKTPLVTSKMKDESDKQWDVEKETGLRFEKTPQLVEYRRDIVPILKRSCVACHTKKWKKPAGGLVLDDDDTLIDGLPGTYFRLANDDRARFSPKLLEPRREGNFVVRRLHARDAASHYIWKFQSRRSLLVWNIYGERLDGYTNDFIPSEELALNDPRRKKLHIPGNREIAPDQRLILGDVDYTGQLMPPPSAVEGKYKGPEGKTIKVSPLTDEDRRTIVRWIDLGCPIDLVPKYAGRGGICDDTRPTLTLTHPNPGSNPPLHRILIGMHDYNAGLDLKSFRVTADFKVDGIAAGEDLTPKFKALPGNRWELRLSTPITNLDRGKLVVAIDDRAGNRSQIERTFSIQNR